MNRLPRRSSTERRGGPFQPWRGNYCFPCYFNSPQSSALSPQSYILRTLYAIYYHFDNTIHINMFLEVFRQQIIFSVTGLNAADIGDIDVV